MRNIEHRLDRAKIKEMMIKLLGKKLGRQDDGNTEACQLKIVQLKGHDRKTRFKDHVYNVRYTQMEESGTECTLTGQFSGLGDYVVHVAAGDALHGDIGV